MQSKILCLAAVLAVASTASLVSAQRETFDNPIVNAIVQQQREQQEHTGGPYREQLQNLPLNGTTATTATAVEEGAIVETTEDPQEEVVEEQEPAVLNTATTPVEANSTVPEVPDSTPSTAVPEYTQEGNTSNTNTTTVTTTVVVNGNGNNQTTNGTAVITDDNILVRLRSNLLYSECIRRDAFTSCLRSFCPENSLECGCQTFDKIQQFCMTTDSATFQNVNCTVAQLTESAQQLRDYAKLQCQANGMSVAQNEKGGAVASSTIGWVSLVSAVFGTLLFT